MTPTPKKPVRKPAKDAKPPTNKPWHVGEVAQSLVENSNRSHQEVALMVGVAYQTLYRWYAAPEWPFRNLRRFADALGVNIDWLRSGDGPQYRHDFKARMREREEHRFLAVVERVTKDHVARMIAIETKTPDQAMVEGVAEPDGHGDLRLERAAPRVR